MFSSFFCLHQSVAVFTPLIVIVVFTSMKRAERGDMKEASLGKKVTAAHMFLVFNVLIYVD